MIYEIITERLVLRPLNITDLEIVHIFAADPENTTYMMYLPNETIDETSEFLSTVSAEWQKDKPDFYEFVVVYNGLQIGAVSIYLDDTRKTGELGWIIDKKYWKKGFAMEAAFAIKDFAFNTIKVAKIIARCDHRNLDSFKLMKRIGLELENDSGIRTYPKTGEMAGELTCSANSRCE